MVTTTLPRQPRRFQGQLWTLERLSDPATEPMTLAAMKTALREFQGVTGNDDEIEDAFIAAREWVENFTGQALIDQAWRLTIDNQSGAFFSMASTGDSVGGIAQAGGMVDIQLRRSPVLEITSFVSVDATGAETTIDPATYALCESTSKWPRIGRVSGGTWSNGTFKIEFRAGYVDDSGSPQVGSVPRRFLQAVKLYAEALYDRDTEKMQLLMEAAENVIKSECTGLGIA